MIIIGIACLIIVPLAGCMALAHFTDHESAGAAGCIEEGQVW